jgi:hypothetical protein
MELVAEYDVPLIKARKVYGSGVYEDAVTWVAFDAPDDPLEHLADMTMGQIEALPDLKFEAKRRLDAPPPAPCEPKPLWTQPPLVSITDAPDERSNQCPHPARTSTSGRS